MIDATEKLLTMQEVCDLLGVHAKTVKALVDRGDLPAYRRGSGPRAPFGFRRADLDKVWRPDRSAASHHERNR